MIDIRSASLWAASCRQMSTRRVELRSRIEALARTAMSRRTFYQLHNNRQKRQSSRARILNVLRKLAAGTTQIALRTWRDAVILQRHAEARAETHCRRMRCRIAFRCWKRSREQQVVEREARLRTAVAFWGRRILVRCIRRLQREVASTRRFQRMAVEGAALLMGKGLVMARACKSCLAVQRRRTYNNSPNSRKPRRSAKVGRVYGRA